MVSRRLRCREICLCRMTLPHDFDCWPWRWSPKKKQVVMYITWLVNWKLIRGSVCVQLDGFAKLGFIISYNLITINRLTWISAWILGNCKSPIEECIANTLNTLNWQIGNRFCMSCVKTIKCKFIGRCVSEHLFFGSWKKLKQKYLFCD